MSPTPVVVGAYSRDPFPNIAADVIQAYRLGGYVPVGACTLSFERRSESCRVTSRCRSPRIAVAVGAARAAFPIPLGRQSHRSLELVTSPLASTQRVLETDEH